MTQDITDLALSINSAWVLVTAFLVFFMQLGFANLEAGFVRAKNAGNILMKNIFDLSIGAIVFFLVGFGIAFGGTGAFIGTSLFAPDLLSTEIFGLPIAVFLIFQFAFAATAATIASGAMAERTKFKGYLVATAFVTGFIYPVVVHWIWGGGWLSTVGSTLGISEGGMLDFAGSTVVHSVGAWVGLMGAIILGPRIGRFIAKKECPDCTSTLKRVHKNFVCTGKDCDVSIPASNTIPGHDLRLAAAGMLILWFGWYGFNPGSTLGLTDGLAALAGKIAVNTTLAAAAAGLSAMLLTWKFNSKKPDLGMSINGAIGGLVAITAPCAFVSGGAAILIGLAAGPVVVYGIGFLERIGVDDPVGVIPVHGFAGVLGTLSIGLFHEDLGLFMGGDASQLLYQAIGVVAVFAWTAGLASVLFLGIKYLTGLRVSPDEEEVGLDIAEHGASVLN